MHSRLLISLAVVYSQAHTAFPREKDEPDWPGETGRGAGGRWAGGGRDSGLTNPGADLSSADQQSQGEASRTSAVSLL